MTGARQKETQAINASLSALGDVVGAMAGGESHVPYRNSKLTHLLKDSLGGTALAVMLCTISPAPTQASLLLALPSLPSHRAARRVPLS